MILRLLNLNNLRQKMLCVHVIVVICVVFRLSLPVEGSWFGKLQQALCVKGQLKCRTNPASAASVRVKLYDEDTGPNPDELMADGLTDEHGNFSLCGSASDPFGNIDPVFKVYHKCNEEDAICKRKISFKIGDQYIDGTFEFQEPIDLTLKYASEERKCIQLPIDW